MKKPTYRIRNWSEYNASLKQRERLTIFKMKLLDLHIAAAVIWQNWIQSTRIDELPANCRPNDRAEAYAVQAELARLYGQAAIGWMIAATSLAGQAHVGVDWPLAGRLLSQFGAFGLIEAAFS